MTTHTAEFSYPVRAFGQKKCDQIARELGVTFKPFDKSDRKNGFQRITFTGPNVLAINGALDMLDEAVTKFNRHKGFGNVARQSQKDFTLPRATQGETGNRCKE